MSRIALSTAQKEALKTSAGFAPDTLEVWPLKDAKNTCTCELLNIGVRTGAAQVEVPHFLLGATFAERGRWDR